MPPRPLILMLALAALRAKGAHSSAWVSPGPDGKLAYGTTANGDRILDFSHAGYEGGGVALPEVPVRATVAPDGGPDDTALIQGAIDRVSALPLVDGFRGAVLLAPGAYVCAGPLAIAASGVVLRGSGSAAGPARSTVLMKGGRHAAIVARNGRGRRGAPAEREQPGAAEYAITDRYIPSGASSFEVADSGGLAVGDRIEVRRPVTEGWVHFMGMDDLTREGRPETWLKPGTFLATERRIAAIAGRRVTLDAPLSDSFDARYLDPPGPKLVRLAPAPRLTHVGIERLHIESPRQEVNHTQELYSAIQLGGEDCWVRDVAIDETMNSVGVTGRRITLERVRVVRQALHQGDSKPAEFAPNGTQVLLDRCSVVADNVWFAATGEGVAGPIVLLNCTFVGNGRSEAHQRWSTGLLYDNCRAPEGGLEIRNRGSMGSGHGWGMGWGVIWNCTAQEYLVQNPPGALNWIIGSSGRRDAEPRPFGDGPDLAGGTDESPGRPVEPQSLYLAQLAERLGPGALHNLGYASARIDPAPDPEVEAAARRLEASARHAAADPELGRDLAIDLPVLASNVRGGDRNHAGWQALDGDDRTYWATDDGKDGATLLLDTAEGGLRIAAVEIREPSGLAGRVKAYRVEAFSDNVWKVLAEGAGIDGRVVRRFPAVRTWKVRLTILKASPYAAISTFALYGPQP